MTAPRVRIRVWSRNNDGRRSWRVTCPICHGSTMVCRTHDDALSFALRHARLAHMHPSDARRADRH